MDGWEEALNSIIKTTEKNLVEFRTHSNPLVSAPSWDKENASPMAYNLVRGTCEGSYSNHTAELADLRGLIQRTESKLASDIDQTSRDCERNLDQLRQELRVKTA